MSESETEPDDRPAPSVDPEFVERLDEVIRAKEKVMDLTDLYADVNTGLDDEDAQRLIYACLPGFSLTDVRNAFEAIEEIEHGESRGLFVRLLSSVGKMSMEETDEFLSEVERLHDKYGHLVDEEQ